MTREEAKRRMEICRDFLANNYSDMGESNFTAFNMALKALSQEPQCTEHPCLGTLCRYYKEPCDDVRKLPSVTQKSGRIPDNTTNSELFKQIFGIYATELWTKSESEFLEWINERYQKG